jgi:putative membrane protein
MTLQALFPRDPFNRALLLTFVALWGVSCIAVPYPKYFWLQHVPTAMVMIALVAAQNRLRISRWSYGLILAFMLLHVMGARYLYSYVPYDEWSQWLFGARITDHFGFTRNHYDRLVHFFFGLLLVFPAWRCARRFAGTGAWWSAVFAMSIILAASALYEVFEWLVAITMAPDWAESYNGQQGDLWDAQRDMALAALGALLGLGGVAPAWLLRRGRSEFRDAVR